MPPKSKGGGGGKAGGGGGGKAGAPYKSGPSRGNQKFEVPNKMKEKRGGGDDWRQWSRTPFQIAMTEGSAHDFHAKAFVPGTKGKAALNQMVGADKMFARALLYEASLFTGDFMMTFTHARPSRISFATCTHICANSFSRII